MDHLTPLFRDTDKNVKHAEFYGVNTNLFTKKAIVYLSLDELSGSRECLSDIRKTGRAQQMLCLINTLCHIVSNPVYGTHTTGENGKAMGMEASHYFPNEDGDELIPRTEQYIEVVRDGDGSVKGYRFFFFVVDPNFSFDYGIEKLISYNEKLEEKRMEELDRGKDFKMRKLQPWESYRHVKSRQYWVTAVLGSYLGQKQFMESADASENSLHDEETAASCKTALGPVWSIAHSGGPRSNIRPEQLDTSRYMEKDDPGAEDSLWTYVFPFPEDVYRYRTQQCHPALMWRMTFPDVKTPPMHWASHLSEEAIFNELLLRQYSVVYHSVGDVNELMEAQRGEKNDLQMLVEQNQKEIQNINETIPSRHDRIIARRALRESSKFAERFKRIWDPSSNLPTTLKSVVVWGALERDMCYQRGEKWYLWRSGHSIPDPTLSSFGNMAARYMFQLEKVFGAVYCHEEIFLLKAAQLGAFHHSKKMKTNILFTGKGESGKSFVHDTCFDTSIMGTISKISHETKNANNVSSDQNYKVFAYDECPARLLGLSGGEDGETGDPEFKSRLTNMEVTVKEFFRDPITNERKCKVVTTDIISLTIGNTNERKSKIPQALATRFFMRNFIEVDRDGHNVMDQRLSARLHQKGAGEFYSTAIKEYKTIQYLVALMETMIQTGDMEEPNMTVAHLMFLEMLKFLKTKGVNTRSIRSFMRLMNQARSYVMWHAAYIVFFTNAVWDKYSTDPSKKPEPFELWHVKLCQPYLFASAEIAYFVMAQMRDMYVDPMEAYVIRSLAKAECKFSESGASEDTEYKELRCLPGESHPPKDYNYVKIPLYVQQNQSVFAAATAKTLLCLKDGLTTTSGESIMDVFTELQNRTMYTHEYTMDATTKRVRKQNYSSKYPRPILEFNRWGNASMYVLHGYLDEIFSNDYDKLIENAIKSTFHKYERSRRIVLGETYRDTPFAHDVVAPHILKVMVAKPNPNRIMTLSNPGHLSTLESMVVDERDNASEHGDALANASPETNSQIAYRVDGDLEKLEFMRHLVNLGCENDPEAWAALPEHLHALFFKNKPNEHMSYPLEWLTSYQKDESITRDLRSGLLDCHLSSQYNYSNLSTRADGSSIDYIVPPGLETTALRAYNASIVNGTTSSRVDATVATTLRRKKKPNRDSRVGRLQRSIYGEDDRFNGLGDNVNNDPLPDYNSITSDDDAMNDNVVRSKVTRNQSYTTTNSSTGQLSRDPSLLDQQSHQSSRWTTDDDDDDDRQRESSFQKKVSKKRRMTTTYEDSEDSDDSDDWN